MPYNTWFYKYQLKYCTSLNYIVIIFNLYPKNHQQRNVKTYQCNKQKSRLGKQQMMLGAKQIIILQSPAGWLSTSQPLLYVFPNSHRGRGFYKTDLDPRLYMGLTASIYFVTHGIPFNYDISRYFTAKKCFNLKGELELCFYTKNHGE